MNEKGAARIVSDAAPNGSERFGFLAGSYSRSSLIALLRRMDGRRPP